MNMMGNKKVSEKSLKKALLNTLPPRVKSSLQIKPVSGEGDFRDGIRPLDVCPIFDVHVHMGQYFDDYYTPPRVLRTLKCAGITHFAYSSTSNVVTDDPVFMREERDAMHELSEGRAVPFLWVTHSMLRKSRDLSLYLDDKIKGLKVHGVSEKWKPYGKSLARFFDIADERNLAIMLHTGEKNECFAGMYEPVIKKHPVVKVILAHGRPLNQTIDVLRHCPNAFVDTAFMPHEHLRTLIQNGFADRVLFGTDTPIPGRNIKSSLPRYLRSRIMMSKKITDGAWCSVSWTNAQRILYT